MIPYFRCSMPKGGGRIGKAVQFRHVPNAVRTMLRQQATGEHREGADGK